MEFNHPQFEVNHGAVIGSTTGGTNSNLTDVNIAREYNGRYLKARVDEVRISDVARSSNWVWAVYPNIAANNSFVSYGAAGTSTPMPPQVTSASFDPGGLQLHINGSLGFNYTLKASTNLVTWTNLITTKPLALPFGWKDSNTINFSRRFFRVLTSP